MDSFFSGRELTRPYTCGKRLTDYTMEELQELVTSLTEEERRSPFARYYDQPMPPLQPEMLPALEGPLSPEQCYLPGEAVKIMLTHDPKYPQSGFGVLANGVGYASAFVRQEGITDEMIAHYREHFAHEEDNRTLFYKLWYPGYHYVHLEDAIVEDFGWGPILQEMNWELLDMKKHLGVTREEILALDPHCLAIMGLGGTATNVNHPEDVQHTFMVQYHRETEKGRELWIHYWVGVKVNADGTMDICPGVDHDTMEMQVKCMMRHAMAESCNEVELIRQFWRESGKE